jgi:sortase A
VSEFPVKIEIPAINLSTTVSNPTSTVIKTLDEELLKGAVRYPTSALLGEMGNVVLFGHSSYLPVVINQAYKAFNDIQKLTVGDVVIVYSSGTAYTYAVRTVEKESTNTAGIPLKVDGRVLTLSTCDSFGAKSDRFVVTADFVESHSISI